MTQIASSASPRSSIGWANCKPSIVASILFVLLFSGPPRFRQRDSSASLRGDVDAVVIIHVLVGVVAGLWVFYQMRFYFQENLKPVGFRLPQKLGLGLVVSLGLSTFVSVAPPLTAFMVYKMFILLMFTMVFVERYGVEACLKKLFQGSAVLCVAVLAAVLVNPDLVVITTETGALRLRGDYIAGTEGVALLCLVLLLAGVQKISKITYGLLLSLCCVLLVASLSRSAYVSLFLIFLLVLLKRPSSKPFRRFAYVSGFATVLAFTLDLASGFSQYRDPQSMWTLSDRVGLWTFLSITTLQKSPFLGLGYYAASRVYGIEYNPGLGTAHSMFFETFAGGGIIAITILVALCVVMSIDAIRIFFRGNTNLSFAVGILFLLTLMSGFMATIDSGPTAHTFWSLAAILPVLLRNLGSDRAAMTLSEPQR
jgi:O-antigen ligase/polysaccharide polymerase Wzy-like membrane protein